MTAELNFNMVLIVHAGLPKQSREFRHLASRGFIAFAVDVVFT